MKYDLHVHSNISDGKISREEIIKKAVEEELKYISFTEHNDFKLIDENLKNNDINFINGIEFDTFLDKSFHTLCYFTKIDNDIYKIINTYKENTNDRSELLINNISKFHNIEIDIDMLKLFFNKTFITKRDIIDWLLINKYAKTVDEAAYKFTSKSAISYVPKYSLNFIDLATIKKSIGGKLILAHPYSLNYNIEELDNFVKKLCLLGLDGIEVINTSKISKMQINEYKQIANKYKILTSAGSDFHDFERHNIGVEGNESKKLIKALTL